MVLPLVVVLAAAAPAEPVKLAAPTLAASGIDPSKAAFLSDFLAQQLAAQGIRVTSENEIGALIGVERQRQLLACDEKGSQCMSELAGALGVDGVITGSLAKTESGGYVAAVKVIRASDGAPLALASTRVSSEDALIDWFTSVAPKLAADVNHTMRPGADVPAVASATSSGGGSGAVVRYVPFVAGGALVIAGGVFYGLAKSSENALRSGKADIKNSTELQQAIDAGNTQQTLGFALGGAGIAALAVGAILAVTHGDSQEAPAASTTVSLLAGPGSAGIAISGVIP